jgi:hypothetical protein
MGQNTLQRLQEWLKSERDEQGYDAAKQLVEDWLCTLEELSEAGVNVVEIECLVRAAADRLNIAITKAIK